MAKKKAKRRTISAKQRANLAKGRAVLRAMQGGKRRKVSKRRKTIRGVVPEKLEPIIIKGESMAKRKKSRKARRIHGGMIAGLRTRKKSRRYHGIAGKRRTARRYHGAEKFNVVALATEIIGVGVGAVGGSFIATKVPIANGKIKALIPIALGLGLGMTKFGKSNIAKAAAGGMIAVGTLSLVKQFFPTLPLLTGADDAEGVAGAIDALPEEERALLGYVVSGEGYETPETMGVIEAPLSPDQY